MADTVPCEIFRVTLPSAGVFKQVLRWLNFLSDTYTGYQDGRRGVSEVDMMSLVMIITSTIQSAIKMVRRTQALVMQYGLLCQKIHSITAHKHYTVYDSAWNSVQVYSGMCHVYVQFMVEHAEGMIQLCTIADALNTDFVTRYRQHI